MLLGSEKKNTGLNEPHVDEEAAGPTRRFKDTSTEALRPTRRFRHKTKLSNVAIPCSCK